MDLVRHPARRARCCRRRIVAIALVALLGSAIGAPAAAGPKNMKTYCISGNSNGATWGWTVEDATTFAVLANQGGLAVTSGLPATALRDTFVTSMGGLENAPPYIFVRPTSDPGCVAPDAAFFISAQDAFNLLVTAAGTGTPTLVAPPPALPVSFNPDIFQLPEPGTTTMLLAGVFALIGLARRRRAGS